MAYTFKNPKKITFPIRKNAAESAALEKLRSFLDAKEPGLVRFLVNLWRAQGKAITYKELREAILAGEISAEYMDQWIQDYTKFVTDHMQAAWEESMKAAAAELEKKYPEWYFDPYAEGVKTWTADRAAAFVTNSTDAQIQSLRAIVRRAATMENMTVDELSRVIRPMVGLTQQQSIANLKYYEKLRASGVSEKRAMDLSMKYAAKMHRYRAYNIARTEMAFAYNKGSYEGTKQAQEAGYMGEVVKIWCTADDERTCTRVCAPLEGKRIAMDEDFDFNTKLRIPGIRLTPPAHPGCRCTVLYEEIGPPTKKRD
jgi:hypothetical protein